MRFERPKRVRYRKNPLVEVSCQINFPRLLRVDAGIPVEFQDALKGQYPILEIGQSLSITIPQNVPQGAQNFATANMGMPGAMPPGVTTNKVWRFRSLDRTWSLNLTSESMHLMCMKYTSWEDYRTRLAHALELLINLYSPPLLRRVSLKYRDIVNRKAIGLADTPWAKLLKPEFIGAIGVEPFSLGGVLVSENVVVCSLDNGQLQIRHGLVRRPNDNQQDEYQIQADFTKQAEAPFEVQAMLTVLDDYNRQAGGFFQWCLSEDLYNALDPEVLSDG